MVPNFEAVRPLLENEFKNTQWIEESGLSAPKLQEAVSELEKDCPSKAVAKAKTFELILNKAQIAVDTADIFQDKLLGGNIMLQQLYRWERQAANRYMRKEDLERNGRAWNEFGAYVGCSDYGHTSPNSQLMLSVGFVGLLQRVEQTAASKELTPEQAEFYDCCRTVLKAMMAVSVRLSKAVEPYNPENARALASIADGKPQNIYEAMQLIILYFFMHEYVGGTRVRTLGRLDVMLYPFYKNDLANGTHTRQEIKELIKFFLFKFYAADVPYGLPFCLGGIDADGNEVTNELSALIVEAYNELNVHSPKIHIRVSEKTPKAFLKQVLACIRGGNPSFVFVNDRIGIETLMRVGIEEADARNYLPIGCYEPAVWGVEIGCTGNGGVNLGKAIELVITNGRDHASGELIGLKTGVPQSFEEFCDAVKRQIAYMLERAMAYVVEIESLYKEINPNALLSCQYDHSVECGVDVYEGGAKYNNSSLYFYAIGSLVDSLCAVKKLVFDDGRYTFEELAAMLKNNWEGHEKERTVALRLREKYGNLNPVADQLAVEFSSYCASLVNNKPNGRGGVFKAALFSIDAIYRLGKLTMATPDGRLAGEPLSKNMSATIGMDRNGVTALIGSVTKMDHAAFPNGSVLDIMLHPSAVSGEDGLEAFYGILMTYFKKGGYAIHGNVLDVQTLRDAQAEPEKYRNLQIRVCGWNAYFVNLSKAEQDAFIRQAEAIG